MKTVFIQLTCELIDHTFTIKLSEKYSDHIIKSIKKGKEHQQMI